MRPFSKSLVLNLSYRLPVIGLCAFIFWQSSSPAFITKSFFPHDDKVFHFSAYALLAFLCARDLGKEYPFWPVSRITLISFFFASLYGLSDELHQAFVPQRFASFYDIIANCAGSISGSLFYIKFWFKQK